MTQFDGYVATTRHADCEQLRKLIQDAVGPFQEVHTIGRHGFRDRLALRDAAAAEVASVQWSGAHREGVTMLEVKGEHTPAVVERLRASFDHQVSRVDSCVDFDEPGCFDKLLATVRAVKTRYGLIGEMRGDWDLPERGRTQTVGSHNSPTTLRLYEKGKQREYLHLNRPDWVRMEVQVRPRSNRKHAYSRLSPLEFWGASRWSRELADLLLNAHVDPHPAGTVYRLPVFEQKLHSMCKQYFKVLIALFEDSGSWDLVGRNIGLIVQRRT